MTMTTKYNGRQLHDHVQMAGANNALRLPWPMTSGETALYVVIMLGVTLGSIVAVLWGSFQLIEPSLWRLAPTVIWVIALKYWLGPGLVRALMPDDVQERWTAFSETNPEPPTGASRS